MTIRKTQATDAADLCGCLNLGTLGQLRYRAAEAPTSMPPLAPIRAPGCATEREANRHWCSIQEEMAKGSAFRLLISNDAESEAFTESIRSVASAQGVLFATARLGADNQLCPGVRQAGALRSALVVSMLGSQQGHGGGLHDIMQGLGEDSANDARPARNPLVELNGGDDFARAYGDADRQGNNQLRGLAWQWLSSNDAGRTPVGKQLRVRSRPAGFGLLTELRLIARLARLSGRPGLVVVLKDLDAICALPSVQARQRNFDAVKTIVTELLTGADAGLAVLLLGSHDSVHCRRQGLHSHPSLRDMLRENPFAVGGLVDLQSPVQRLSPLGG